MLILINREICFGYKKSGESIKFQKNSKSGVNRFGLWMGQGSEHVHAQKDKNIEIKLISNRIFRKFI